MKQGLGNEEEEEVWGYYYSFTNMAVMWFGLLWSESEEKYSGGSLVLA